MSSPTMESVLEFETFTRVLLDYFSIDDAPTTAREARLVEDLAFDSLRFFELALMLEDVAGFVIPSSVLADLQDLGDVYHYYALYAGQHIHEPVQER